MINAAINLEQSETYNRAFGAIVGLAIGDALGMPTQSMSAQSIRRFYGGPITKLMDAVSQQPIAPNMKAGSVTDDTEQAFLLAERIIADNGNIDNNKYAQNLLDWEDAMREKGSLDLLGPSTKSALKALVNGVIPEETGKFGTTNGGAMRATPIGIAFKPGESLAKAARKSCLITHNTTQGIESTTLVAAAVSLGIEGCENPLKEAIKFVKLLPKYGNWSAKASVISRVEFFTKKAEELSCLSVSDDDFAEMLQNDCGTSVEANESVAAAFAIATRFANEPTKAACFAASIGGDTDTIAAMCSAMLGSQYGLQVFDEKIRERVLENLRVDHCYDVEKIVYALCLIRKNQKIEKSREYAAQQLSEAIAMYESNISLNEKASLVVPQVISLGQIIVDVTMKVSSVPKPGEDIFANSYSMSAGASYNMLFAASQMGAKAQWAGVLGEGYFANIISKALNEARISHIGTKNSMLDSGFCIALTDKSAERTFISTKGAETSGDEHAFDFVNPNPEDVVYISGYTFVSPIKRALLRFMLRTSGLCGLSSSALESSFDKHKRRFTAIFDASPMIANILDEDLKALIDYAPIWLCNAREAEILAKRLNAWGNDEIEDDCSEDADESKDADSKNFNDETNNQLTKRKIERLQRALRAPLIVHAGSHGAWVCDLGKEAEHIKGFQVKAVDTNGAGDAHTGVLAACIGYKMTLKQAVLCANAAAAIAVTKYGPATCPTKKVIEDFIKTNVY